MRNGLSSTPSLQQIDIMQNHPCFSSEAHDRTGRSHLPVASRCNIQCAFCRRRVCANLKIQHPGWTSELLSPKEAFERVRSTVRLHQREIFVVGVAGPGEPIANDETFQTLDLVHREYPHLMKCLSTNGLLLEEMHSRIVDAGIKSLTLTVNAPDSAVGRQIYAWVHYGGRIYREREAVELLIRKQMNGIQAALDARLAEGD